MNKSIDITGIVLQTDRLTLRPFRDTDLQDFNEYASVDEEIVFDVIKEDLPRMQAAVKEILQTY